MNFNNILEQKACKKVSKDGLKLDRMSNFQLKRLNQEKRENEEKIIYFEKLLFERAFH